jgi:mannose-6-phosphate isomerase-like protein (cupin superfamily)
VITVGTFRAGTKRNIIGPEATLQLTVRSYKAEVQKHLLEAIARIARAEAAASGAPREPLVTIDAREASEVVVNDPALVERLAGALRQKLGETQVVASAPFAASEDFGLLGRAAQVPSAQLRLGASDPALLAQLRAAGSLPPGPHNGGFAPQREPTLRAGVALLTLSALELLGTPGAQAVRRVVTGRTGAGKSTVASDTEVGAITVGLLPGAEFFRVWGADAAPTLPDDGAPRPGAPYFPPPGGFRFGLVTLAPRSVAQPREIDAKLARAEMEAKLPGMAAHLEADHPGMHTSDSVDFEYIVSGELWLELDDGKEVHLKAGDTVVQNGTRHAWRNKGTEPCRMVFCLIGAQRR